MISSVVTLNVKPRKGISNRNTYTLSQNPNPHALSCFDTEPTDFIASVSEQSHDLKLLQAADQSIQDTRSLNLYDLTKAITKITVSGI